MYKINEMGNTHSWNWCVAIVPTILVPFQCRHEDWWTHFYHYESKSHTSNTEITISAYAEMTRQEFLICFLSIFFFPFVHILFRMTQFSMLSVTVYKYVCVCVCIASYEPVHEPIVPCFYIWRMKYVHNICSYYWNKARNWIAMLLVLSIGSYAFVAQV